MSDKNDTAPLLFKALLTIVEKIYGDAQLQMWAICTLNGIIEDARTRIKHLEHL
jgi:hypothetical protein